MGAQPLYFFLPASAFDLAVPRNCARERSGQSRGREAWWDEGVNGPSWHGYEQRRKGAAKSAP